MADLTIHDMMTHMPATFQPDAATGVDAVIQCNLTGEEAGDWVITIRNGQCQVTQGQNPAANLTLTVASQDFKDLAFGKLNGMQAFMQGKLKLGGDLSLAMRFNSFFKI
jgi:putative sterol carrier protein